MSGSRRRLSKWDHRDSEALSENFHDRDPARKPREPPSPSRGSHRHESRSRERMISSDREGNSLRMSPSHDEWRHQHHSRSPRNGWDRSYRSRSRSRSRSGSRSRSRSPAYNSRREPIVERNRTKPGVSAQVCRDFAAGRCRRGNHCQFLHQDVQPYDNRRPLGSSPPDNWESRDRRTGGSRYSPDGAKDYSIRSERSTNLCNDFLKGRCRRGGSCRYVHHDASAGAFERGRADDVYRDRDNDHRTRHTYPDRNHDREPSRRGETLCKFFAAGNCRNGNHCRFSHQVQEDFGPEGRSKDDRRRSDSKYDGSPVWDEPRWSEAKIVSNVPAVQGWGEDKNETTEVTQDSPAVRSGDDSWNHGMVEMKQTWDAPASIDELKPVNENQPLPWKTENIVPSMDPSTSIGLKPMNQRQPLPWNTENSVPSMDLSASIGLKPVNENQPLTWKTENSVPSLDPSTSIGLKSMNERQSPPWNVENSVPSMDLLDSIELKPANEKQPLPWETENSVPSLDHSAAIGLKPVNEKRPLPWNKENSVPSIDLSASIGIENYPGGMEISPKDVCKQHSSSSSNPQSNISFSAVQQDTSGHAPYEKHYPSVVFEEQKSFGGPYGGRNPNFEGDKPYMYPVEGRKVIGNNDRLCSPPIPPMNVQQGHSVFQGSQCVQPFSSLNAPAGQSLVPFPSHPSGLNSMQFSTPNLQMNVPPGRGIFQGDPHVNVQPMLSMNPPAGQSHLPLPLHPSAGNGMQASHNPPSFLDNKLADGLHLPNVNTSVLATVAVTNQNTVTSEQLAQLTHLSASLAQLLETRQQAPLLSSAVTSNGMSNLLESAASIPPVSSAALQPIQAPETVGQNVPICDSIDREVSNLGNHGLPSLVEPKRLDNELCDSGKVNQPEPPTASKDDNSGKVAEGGRKLLENKPSEDDVAVDDGADDCKKSKDAKGLRSFKFALADFIKELLKPTWNDGHVSKEAYKTIVKKVVDKVIGTQGLQIPQTKEKIDQYLSSSKPKLEKLVQAYVGKYQKSQP